MAKKIIAVEVVPKSRKNQVVEFDQYLKVSVNDPAEKGKANKAMIKLLAKHFHLTQNRILILSGTRMRKKLVEIDF